LRLRRIRARRGLGSGRRPGRGSGLRTRWARAAHRSASGRHPERRRGRRGLRRGRRRRRLGTRRRARRGRSRRLWGRPRRGRSRLLPRSAGAGRAFASSRSTGCRRGLGSGSARARRRAATRPGPRGCRSWFARRARSRRWPWRRRCFLPGSARAVRALGSGRRPGRCRGGFPARGRRRVRRRLGALGAYPTLATRRKVDHPDLLPWPGHDRLGGVEQARQRLSERVLQRGEQLGPGAESAVTLAEVLPRKLPEPLHAQLLQVVHQWSEVGSS
jgi:hypothetical protein